MIIEFMGLPGSGKTTLQKHTADILQEMNYNVFMPDAHWKEEREYFRLSFQGAPSNRLKYSFYLARNVLLKAPTLLTYINEQKHFVRVVVGQIHQFSHTLKYKALLAKYFLIDFFQYSLFERNPKIASDMILIDEGFIQHVYTLYTNRRKNIDCEALKQYLSYVPIPHLLFFVKTDPDLCYTRMEQRGITPYRLRGEPDGVLRDSLDKGIELFSKVEAYLAEEKSNQLKIVEINCPNGDQALVDLKKHLSTYLGQDYRNLTSQS